MEEKYNILKTISNPQIVLKKAKKYLGDNVCITISTRKTKKYQIYNPNTKKWVHFGSFNPPLEDFTYHKDPYRRMNYLLRATNINGNWKNNPYSPNNLSINILW